MTASVVPLMTALVRHYDDLVNSVRRRFGDRIPAHDVVHDVCVRLLAEPPTEIIHTPEAFLRRLTTHLAIDRHRVDTARRAWVDSVGEVPDALDFAAGPHEQLVFERTVRALCRVVETLPPRCREVFILHKLHDLPQSIIADRLCISRNMVTQHVARAMRTIEPLLLGQGLQEQGAQHKRAERNA